MKIRSILPLALAASGVLGFIYACSAPDPGAIVYVPRTTQSGTGDLDGGSNPITTTEGGGGSVDSGPQAPTNAFSGEGVYEAGVANDNSLNTSHNGVHNSQDAGIPSSGGKGNPAGMNCLDSACHAPMGGQAGPWTFAGTVYTSPTTPAPAGVEVRVIDMTTGAQCDSVYTDAQGNFWSSTGNTFPSANFAGARNGPTPDLMLSPATGGGCNNTSACHATGANPMLP